MEYVKDFFMEENEYKMYAKAGGGEEGKKVVLAWRAYLKDYNEEQRRYKKTKYAESFHPRSEKTKPTVAGYSTNDEILNS